MAQIEIKLLPEKEVKALKFPGQHLARKIPLAKTVVPSSSDGKEGEGKG